MSKKKITSLDINYKEPKEDKKTLESIADVFRIETRHAIIMAINTFGSSNIKKLGKILGKNEATIYYHIKELTKAPEFLRIDEEATREQKGIFYKLTDLSMRHFCEAPHDDMEDAFSQLHNLIQEKSDEEVAKFYYDLMAKNPNIGETAIRDRRRLSYNHILENFMMNNLERTEELVKSGAKPKNKNYPFGSISISSIDMKIYSPRQLFEILMVISETFGKLARLEEKFTKEMDKKSISEEERISVHYHFVGGEVAEFEFE
ncbi:MAG: hypothetical protein ACTSPT_07045 [Candidatus Heimdallarchaeota archaeon]